MAYPCPTNTYRLSDSTVFHMSEQLFREIKTIEHQAESLLADSEKQSADILKRANEESLKALAEKENELKEARERAISQAMSEASKLREKILGKNSEELNIMAALAEKRKEKAVQLVLERLSEAIGGDEKHA